MKQTVEATAKLVVMVNYVVAENAQPYKQMKRIAELAKTLVLLAKLVALVFA